MPFTFSHPAAVIPLRKLGVFSALVIGSMMPDTIYFLPFINEHDRYGHTLPGCFFYCLPVGLVVLWLFHHFMKRPLISLFPHEHQGRLLDASPDFRFGPVARFAAIIFSLLVGVLTHDLWDGFTHTDTAFFTTSWLSEPVHVGGPRLQVADVLQMASSILGIVVIVICYWLWLKRTPPGEAPAHSLSKTGRIAAFALFAGSAPIPFLVHLLLNPELWFRAKRRMLISYGIMNGIKLICAEVLVFCILWHLFLRPREQDVSPVSHSY